MTDDKAIEAKIRLINKRISLLQAVKNKSLSYIFDNIKLLSGKRLRGLLVLLTAEANGVKINSLTLDIAASIELLHHATLIHDDIVDKADTRRGERSLNRKIGQTLSVLSGDYLFSLAIQPVLKMDEREYYGIFARTVKNVCEGEIEEEYYKGNARITTVEYLNIIKNKTAALIAGSVKAGAIAGKCSKEAMKHLEIFGENIGMAFQIKDDIMDIVSDPGRLGKPAGNDIKEGKATLPLLLALNSAPKKERENIIRIFREDPPSADKAKILDFIFKYDGVNLSELMAASFVNDAKAALDRAELKNDKKKAALYKIADYVIQREY
jgi:geranylgeranyl pyrophosphate synthase